MSVEELTILLLILFVNFSYSRIICTLGVLKLSTGNLLSYVANNPELYYLTFLSFTFFSYSFSQSSRQLNFGGTKVVSKKYCISEPSFYLGLNFKAFILSIFNSNLDASRIPKSLLC